VTSLMNATFGDVTITRNIKIHLPNSVLRHLNYHAVQRLASVSFLAACVQFASAPKDSLEDLI